MNRKNLNPEKSKSSIKGKSIQLYDFMSPKLQNNKNDRSQQIITI